MVANAARILGSFLGYDSVAGAEGRRRPNRLLHGLVKLLPAAIRYSFDGKSFAR
jgi:hypothetical protein